MKIKFFTIEEMIEKGCFWMSTHEGQDRMLFYDPNEKIKSEEEYLKLTEEEKVNFQVEAWECFCEDEVPYIPCGEEKEIDIEEDRFWIHFNDGLLIPVLPGVIFEVIEI